MDASGTSLNRSAYQVGFDLIVEPEFELGLTTLDVNEETRLVTALNSFGVKLDDLVGDFIGIPSEKCCYPPAMKAINSLISLV